MNTTQAKAFLEKILPAAEKLQTAINELNEATLGNLEDDEQNIFSLGYPFACSLDDVNHDVNKWVNTFKELNNLINR